MMQHSIVKVGGRTLSTLRPATIQRTKVVTCSVRKANVVDTRARAMSAAASTGTVFNTMTASKEETPHQLVAWLKAGIVAAACSKQQAANGGKGLRSLQNLYQVLTRDGGRPEDANLTQILANTTPWLADIAFRDAALSLSWYTLAGINCLNEEPGLAVEKLHPSMHEMVYNVLQDLGCSTPWANPVYRTLPAAAAGLVPGTLGKIPLQQCIELTTHLPPACFDHYDGSWDGDCTIYLHSYQLVPVTELARALNLEQAMAYLHNCSSSRSLSELLLLQLHKVLLTMGAEWVKQGMQQQQYQLPSIHAAATAAVVVEDSCLTTNSCENGSGRGVRGALTAVGAADGDRVPVYAALVPAGLNRQQRDRRALLVSPLVLENTENSEIRSRSSNSSQPNSKQGVLRRLGSAFRCLCGRSRRA